MIGLRKKKKKKETEYISIEEHLDNTLAAYNKAVHTLGFSVHVNQCLDLRYSHDQDLLDACNRADEEYHRALHDLVNGVKRVRVVGPWERALALAATADQEEVAKIMGYGEKS